MILTGIEVHTVDVGWNDGIVTLETNAGETGGVDLDFSPANAFKVGALLMRAARMANGGDEGLTVDGVEFLAGWNKT